MAELIRPSLVEFIKKSVPEWDDKGFVCLDDLGQSRKDYVKEVLQDEIEPAGRARHARRHEVVVNGCCRGGSGFAK